MNKGSAYALLFISFLLTNVVIDFFGQLWYIGIKRQVISPWSNP